MQLSQGKLPRSNPKQSRIDTAHRHAASRNKQFIPNRDARLPHSAVPFAAQSRNYGPSTATSPHTTSDFSKASIRASHIEKFDASQLPNIRRRAHYNDDVVIEHFQSSARHHAGKQRKGVVDEPTERLTLQEPVEAALRRPFFLPLSAPLPRPISDASSFIRGSHPEQIAHFWDSQLISLDRLIADSSEVEKAWAELIPSETAPAACNIRLAALMSLANQCQVGGAVWIRRFLFGSPLVGRLTQPRCYPIKLKASLKKEEPIHKLRNTNESRFSDMARKPDLKTPNLYGMRPWSSALRAGVTSLSRCVRVKLLRPRQPRT